MRHEDAGDQLLSNHTSAEHLPRQDAQRNFSHVGNGSPNSIVYGWTLSNSEIVSHLCQPRLMSQKSSCNSVMHRVFKQQSLKESLNI